MQSKTIKFENLHILFWLIKDFCWISNYKLWGMIMILPTILVAIFIAYKSYGIYSSYFNNLAIVCWITANSIWMIGEFYFDDHTRPYSLVFFIIGFIILAYYYLIRNPFWKPKTVEPFL